MSLALFPLLLKLHLVPWAERVGLHFHLFVRLPSMFGVCLLCILVSSHFSAVHSVVIGCAGDICLLFKLLFLSFENVARAQAPLLIIKILTKTSPQGWMFSSLLNETKRNKEIVHQNIHATRE